MKIHLVFRYVGIALATISILMAVSGLISLAYEGDNSAMPLFVSAYITFTVGLFPMIFTKHSREISTKEAYFIVAFSWLSVCIFGMLPYIIYGGQFTFVDALFESVSGFTTTGASILDNIEALPKGLLFWRAGTAWIGGFGIVTIFSLIVPKGHDVKSVLSSAEMSEIAKSQTSHKGKSFILGMLAIYSLLTSSCATTLHFTGMDWFDAVTNAMCTCSTCGFCVRNNSIAYYDSPVAEYILSAYMVLAASKSSPSSSSFATSPQTDKGSRHRQPAASNELVATTTTFRNSPICRNYGDLLPFRPDKSRIPGLFGDFFTRRGDSRALI